MIAPGLLCLLYFLCSLGGPAHARGGEHESEPPSEPPLYHSIVEASVITGVGLGPQQELSPEELEAKGARDLAEALQGEPGFRISTAPVAGSANSKQETLLSLRGFDAADVLVLVDGAPVADPNSGLVDLARISLDGVRRLVISRGPSSLLYGPGALGGVVHLVTGPPTSGSTALVGMELDELLGSRLRFLAGHRGASAQAYLAGSHRRGPGFRVASGFEPQRNEDGGLRENSDQEDLGLRARGRAQLGSLSLRGGASAADHEGGVPFSVADAAPSNLWRRSWRRQSADLGAQIKGLGPLELRGHGYLLHQLDELGSYTDTSFSGLMDHGQAVSSHDGYRTGLFLAPRLCWPGIGKLGLGYHHQLDLARRQASRRDGWKDYRTETLSLAIEGSLGPLPWLRLQGGVSAVAFFKERAAGQVPGENLPGEDLWDYEWLAGGVLALPAGLLLRGGAARRVGFPTLKRLYGTHGNVELRPQRCLMLDLGLERDPIGPRQIGGEVSLFRSQVLNLIGKGGTPNEM